MPNNARSDIMLINMNGYADMTASSLAALFPHSKLSHGVSSRVAKADKSVVHHPVTANSHATPVNHSTAFSTLFPGMKVKVARSTKNILTILYARTKRRNKRVNDGKLSQTRRCPKCKAAIQKNGECRHMCCLAPACGLGFNWGRAKRYKAGHSGVKVVAVTSLAAVNR